MNEELKILPLNRLILSQVFVRPCSELVNDERMFLYRRGHRLLGEDPTTYQILKLRIINHPVVDGDAGVHMISPSEVVMSLAPTSLKSRGAHRSSVGMMPAKLPPWIVSSH